MAKDIVNRVGRLREYLQENGLSAFIFPSTDPHQGEYVPEHWQTRQWISGFDGSAGTAVVTLSDAALWTDSRYFIAAEEQLAGTPFSLMKDGLAETPSIAEWLTNQMVNGQRSTVNDKIVGVDGQVFTNAEIEEMRTAFGKAGIQLKTDL
ncbi:MAG: aminopeptidase P family N-terminal domain-containing protein, partial [Bacteroidaceae bacterium]|nr:aminopeptidase P family N-terminal domain-containing protein [Bacteroidaceae bacterium]